MTRVKGKIYGNGPSRPEREPKIAVKNPHVNKVKPDTPKGK